jgi:hypothetical protein
MTSVFAASPTLQEKEGLEAGPIRPHSHNS